MSEIIKKADKLFSDTERQNKKNTWSLLSEFLLPNKSGIYLNEETPKGQKKTERLFDSTAPNAVKDLAASFHSTLTNPSSTWTTFRFKDRALEDSREASMWLTESNRILHNFINESNFDTQVGSAYLSLSALATMVMFVEEKPRDREGNFTGVRFEAWNMSQVAFMNNAEGIADTVVRKFKMTIKQLMERFEDPPKEVVELKDQPDKELEVYHWIEPRPEEEVELNEFGLAPENKRPYRSVHVLKHGDNPILQETGYYELPVFVARWETEPNEVYGRGPGDIALPDVRSLNKVKELTLSAAAKAVKPAWGVTNAAAIDQLDLRANAVNVFNGDQSTIWPLNSEARFDVTQFQAEDLRNSIRSVFFIDKLMLPPRQETGEMTAFEIQQRLEQMQRILGPTLSRLNSEFLTPLVERVFGILFRAGQFPQMPNILKQEGVNVDIKFINPLSRSQQLEELNNIRAWLSNVAEVAQVKPEATLYINTSEVIKKFTEARNIPESLVVPEQEVQETLQQRQQSAQAQEQLQQGVDTADILSKLQGQQGG